MSRSGRIDKELAASVKAETANRGCELILNLSGCEGSVPRRTASVVVKNLAHSASFESLEDTLATVLG